VTTTLHLVRHGSHGRLDHVLCGRMEGVALSDAGLAEVRATARRLEREAPASVYSSPLERCRQSAEVLAQALGAPLQLDDGLVEIDFGAWTGKRFDELHVDPGWEAWNARRTQARPPGGESLGEAQMRAVRAVEDVRAAHPQGAVVLVTHSDIVKALACHWLGLSLDFHNRFEVAPASLTTAVVGDWGAKLVRLNEQPYG
jgi:probable phosphoglycerate mutase